MARLRRPVTRLGPRRVGGQPMDPACHSGQPTERPFRGARRPGTCRETPPQAPESMGEARLQPRLRHPQLPPAVGCGDRAKRCLEGPGRVAQAVFAQLGELDPADDRGPARARRDPGPGLGRLVIASEPPKQARAVERDALGVPGRANAAVRCQRDGPRSRGRAVRRSPPGRSATTTARSAARRRAARPRGADGRRRLDDRRDRRVARAQDVVEAGERLLLAPRPDERPGEPGQVPDRRRSPARLGDAYPASRSASSRASDRTSSSLWRTTVERAARPARRAGSRGSGPGSPSRRRRRAAATPSSAVSTVRSRARPSGAGTAAGRSAAGRGGRRGPAPRAAPCR